MRRGGDVVIVGDGGSLVRCEVPAGKKTTEIGFVESLSRALRSSVGLSGRERSRRRVGADRATRASGPEMQEVEWPKTPTESTVGGSEESIRGDGWPESSNRAESCLCVVSGRGWGQAEATEGSARMSRGVRGGMLSPAEQMAETARWEDGLIGNDGWEMGHNAVQGGGRRCLASGMTGWGRSERRTMRTV